jgi:PAP2 superfamily
VLSVSPVRQSRLACLGSLVALLVASSAQAQLPIAAPIDDGGAVPVAPGGEPPADTSATSAILPASPPSSEPPSPAPAAPPQRAAPPATAAEGTPRAVTKPVEKKTERRLKWTYPRFRWWEYAAAGAVTIGNVTMELAYQAKPKERWHDPILLDGPVRKAFKGNREWAQIATDVGDWTWYGVQNYVLLDGIVTPLVSDKLNADVALQLTLLNWQAVGLTGLISRAAHVTVGRTRPSLQGCSNDEDAENKCEFRGASFFSGHTAMTTASAALGCLNHSYLPMYGGGIADDIVCPVLITGAATVGVARIVNDKHWMTDVLAGWAVGGLIGFGLPYALHYGPSAVRVALRPTPTTAFVPWADPTSGGLRFVGML